MAEAKKKKRRVVKKTTVREKANAQPRQRRIANTVSKAKGPAKSIGNFTRREFNIPLPDTKLGHLLNKRIRIIPRFFVEAWSELRQVAWPNRRETIKLSIAVFIFALVFGSLIWVVDFGLEKIFREVIL